MKLFVLIMMGLIMASETYASDKKCLNQCRDVHTNCQLEVQAWTEDQYLSLEGSLAYMKNQDADDAIDDIEAKRKEMKKICKEELKECKQSCKDN